VTVGPGRYRSHKHLGDELNMSIELAPEYDRVPPYDDGFEPAQVERAKQILATSGLTAVFDKMMDGTACVTGNAPWQWDDVVTDLGMSQADLAHQSDAIVIKTVDDIRQAQSNGTVGLMFGLEASTPIGNDIEKLDVLHGLSGRQIGISYSDSNALGSGLDESLDSGLTNLGRRAVGRTNRLGLAIDVPHSSDLTGIQACAASDRPVFLTHAGARAIWDIPRLKSEDALRAIADTGGVIGMSEAPHTSISHAHPRHSILSVMDHFKYCLGLVGIDHVEFGPDTLYGDHVGLHATFAGFCLPKTETAEELRAADQLIEEYLTGSGGGKPREIWLAPLFESASSIANEVFTATSEEISWARGIIDRAGENAGAFRGEDGSMVDEAVARRTRAIWRTANGQVSAKSAGHSSRPEHTQEKANSDGQH
jgi:membrane dipeptidase